MGVSQLVTLPTLALVLAAPTTALARTTDAALLTSGRCTTG
jgi:hypothetical protein